MISQGAAAVTRGVFRNRWRTLMRQNSTLTLPYLQPQA